MEEGLDSRAEAIKPGEAGVRVLFWVVLLLTAAMSVVWSEHKLLGQDEIFSFQTDSVKSLGEVMRIQREYPISLEPPVYHVLAHAGMAVFGATAFALRLPALLGYLGMQVCLYFFVRNIAGRRAGLVAMAVPALTSTVYYAAEGRPYGVLLGSYAAAALCWQVASRRENGRMGPLVGLAAALAMTLNVHFYGVLLLVAVCGAEVVRTLERRRVDWGRVGAIGVGMASLAGVAPYLKASGEFRKHYYAGPVSSHMLTQPYRQLLVDYTTYSKGVQHLLMVAIVACGAGLAWGLARTVRRRTVEVPGAEWAMVLLLSLMPVFAFVLAKLVTHALEPRHSIGAILGISAVAAIVLAPGLRREGQFYGVMAALIVGIVVANGVRVRQAGAASRKTMATLMLAPEVRGVVDASADRNIYFPDLGMWEIASLYEPDAELRSRLVLVYSNYEEMTRSGQDTRYLTAVHTQRFTSLPIASYDQLRKAPGEHTFAVFHSGWTDQALAEEAVEVVPAGEGFGGELVRVRFR